MTTSPAPAAAPAAPAPNPMTEKLRNAVKQAVVRGDFEIPALPHVATEVMKKISDPNVSLGQLEGLLKQDQAMTARIIKMANSVMFRGVQEINSLQVAMARIGLKNVKDIVVTIGVHSNAFKAGGFEDILNKIWERSISTAIIAQEVAKKLLGDRDTAFLAGLLSHIGMSVLVQMAHKLESSEKILAKNEASAARKPFDEKKFRVPGLREEILPIAFEELHDKVGAGVAARWNIPDRILNVIRHQRTPAEAPEDAKKLAWVVNLSQAVSANLGFGQEVRIIDWPAHPAVLALELGVDEVKDILEDSQEKVSAQLSAFKFT